MRDWTRNLKPPGPRHDSASESARLAGQAYAQVFCVRVNQVQVLEIIELSESSNPDLRIGKSSSPAAVSVSVLVNPPGPASRPGGRAPLIIIESDVPGRV